MTPCFPGHCDQAPGGPSAGHWSRASLAGTAVPAPIRRGRTPTSRRRHRLPLDGRRLFLQRPIPYRILGYAGCLEFFDVTFRGLIGSSRSSRIIVHGNDHLNPQTTSLALRGDCVSIDQRVAARRTTRGRRARPRYCLSCVPGTGCGTMNSTPQSWTTANTYAPPGSTKPGRTRRRLPRHTAAAGGQRRRIAGHGAAGRKPA